MTILDRDILFYGGGAALGRHGRIVRTTRPPRLNGEELIETWTRSSTGLYRRRDGQYSSAGNNIPRIERLDLDADGIFETPSIIVEGGGTNIIENGDFETDANGAQSWSGGTVARDSSFAINSTWGLKVTTVNNTQDTGVFFVKRDNTNRHAATAGTVYTASVWVWAGDVAHGSGIGKNVRLRIEWWNAATGGSTTGVTAGSNVNLVSGWQRLTLTGTAPASTTNVVVTLGSADAVGGTYAFWADLVQFEALPFASNPIATNSGAVTRSADLCSIPFYGPPQAMAIYFKFLERGGINIGSGFFNTLLTIGQFGSPNWRLDLYGNGSDGHYHFANGNSNGQVDNSNAGPSVGDVVELIGQVQTNGAIQIIQVRNGGAQVSSGFTSTITMPSTFGTQTIWLGNDNSGSLGYNPLIAAIVVRAPNNVFPSLADFQSLLPTFGPTI